jgi:hypothetical protein
MTGNVDPTSPQRLRRSLTQSEQARRRYRERRLKRGYYLDMFDGTPKPTPIAPATKDPQNTPSKGDNAC